jgi:hypothetical protein
MKVLQKRRTHLRRTLKKETCYKKKDFMSCTGKERSINVWYADTVKCLTLITIKIGW